MLHRRHLLIAALSVVASAAAVAGAPADPGRHPFSADDLVAMERISDPQPSPDGSVVAFVVTTMDLDANHGRSDVWLAASDGSGARRLTTDPAGDWSPRWLDADTLLFLSSRSGSAQVWRLSLTGGEAQQVTDLPLDVESLLAGPEGKAVYVGLKVFPDCDRAIACTVERLAAREADPASGMVFDRLFVRHWDQWKDGRRNHVFRVALPAAGTVASGVDLMAGVDADCPTVPWGGSEDYAVSPDGKWLVYTAKVVDGSEEAWSTDWDLWKVATDGSAPATCLTADNPAWDSSPAFSPDGKRLAWLAMRRPGYESDRRRVVVEDWPDGKPLVVTEAWDRSPDALVWNAAGTGLFATADNLGNHSLFAIDPSTGIVSALQTRHSSHSPQPLPDGSVVFTQDSLVSPAEVYTVAADGGDPVEITALNRDRLAEIEFGAYHQFDFEGAHGDTVYGYLLEPVGFEPGGSYPLAFLIHGGPQGSFGDHWHYRWHPEVYAGHGYGVVMIDFHGSTGYGQAFTDAINRDWGGAPYEDLMKGLDSALAYAPWIDDSRMAALGASYGGYMINWIQGHTDRFRALVCHDGNLDEVMAYFQTEELWFPEWDHGGTPWTNWEGFASQSPLRFVDQWSTPELVIHGALDYRVVAAQGIATFNALQRRGVPSRLLFYPDENHWVLKPQNSLQWHRVVLDWIDRYTAPEEAAPGD